MLPLSVPRAVGGDFAKATPPPVGLQQL